MHAFGLGFHLEHALRVAVHHTWNMPYKQPLKIRAPSAGVRHRGDAAVRVVRWFSSFGMKCVSRISRCARSGRGRQPREVRGLGVIHAQAGRSTEAEDMIIRPNLIFFLVNPRKNGPLPRTGCRHMRVPRRNQGCIP